MRLLLVLLLALSCTIGTANAIAQPGTGELPLTVLADAGFGGHLPADRWTSVRVIVSPRQDSIEGIVRVRFTGPGGMDLRSIAPLTTTPGRETVLPMTVWIPSRFDTMQVEFLDLRGRRLAGTRYDQSGSSTSIHIQAPSINPIVLSVGIPGLVRAFGSDAYLRTPQDDGEREQLDLAAMARIVSVAPMAPGQAPWLPTTVAAYDGVSAVVLDGSVALNLGPEVISVLQSWLVGGGRVMLVNADGNALRAVLGEHLPAGLGFLAPRPMPLPAALGGTGEVRARALSSDVMGNGWKPLPQAPDMAAHGPVGLGWAIVMGLDAADFAGQASDGVFQTMWQGTLGEFIRHDLEAARSHLGTGRYDTQSFRSLANASVYSWISRSPTVGAGAFIAIFAMMMMLGILLGPIDRAVLRRLGLMHRWWLVALGWIALASLGAWLLPGTVRSGPSSVTTVRVIDGWTVPGGGVSAWQASYTGVFMNQSASIVLDDAEASAWVSPMSSPWDFYGSSAPSGQMTWNATRDMMRPLPTVARLWTMRHFQEHGPTAPPMAFRFAVDGGRMQLHLSGPAASRLEHVSVHTGGKWLNMLPGGRLQSTRDGFLLVASWQDFSDAPSSLFEGSTGVDSHLQFAWYDGSTKPTPAMMTQLAAPRTRTMALEALGTHEDWAVVYATWSDDHRSLAGNVGEEFRTLWACRLAVPIETIGVARPAGVGQ